MDPFVESLYGKIALSLGRMIFHDLPADFFLLVWSMRSSLALAVLQVLCDCSVADIGADDFVVIFYKIHSAAYGIPGMEAVSIIA